MQKYLDALYEFCIEFKRLENISYQQKTVVFLGASAMLGLLIIILDIIVSKLYNKSFLGMHYTSNSKYLWVIIGWPIATVFVSYLGLIMSVFNTTIQSCVVVGLSWLYIIIQLTNKFTKPESIQE